MRFLVLIFLLSCSFSKSKENHLASFTTDGCSMYPNGTWLHCCLAHDLSYWAGGTVDEKNEVDHELAQCLAKNGSTLNTKVMTGGVQIGGGANNVLPWAWGYGWKKNLGYASLNSHELKEVETQMSSVIPVMREYEEKLSKNQFEYILDKYQKLQIRIAKELQK